MIVPASARCFALLIVVLACACRQPGPETAADESPTQTSTLPGAEQPFLSHECPSGHGPTEEEVAAQAAALVPLKPGLTLSTTWQRATEGDEVECLTHINGIADGAVAATANCSMSTGTQGGTRRTCRADMRAAHAYYTGAGDEPDVLRGTTMFSLSAAAFGELKATGTTRHRFVSVSDGAIIGDMDGELRKESNGTSSTIVNDRVVDLPVLRASGTLRGMAMGKPVATRVTAAIVDDARFPLVLEYALPDIGAAGFAVRYTKVSYPTEGRLEQQLATDERIDVYGIYFDVNSDRLRAESDPVLQEIAEALQRNAAWRLTIDGHTDAVGSAQANMDLSRRRSEAVRSALVGRYGVAADRLSARGHGAAAPKDTNDTSEGRARNRRVELVRN
jgi:outer membrane protein OmpA-like peptidoglycan-associated protein